MVFVLNGATYGCDWSITSSKIVTLEDGNTSELFNALSDFKRLSPQLKSVSLDKTASDYNYQFEFFDGRIWKQNIIIGASGVMTMDFRVTDFFSVPEFMGHRAVRDLLLSLVYLRKMTLFQATWPS